MRYEHTLAVYRPHFSVKAVRDQGDGILAIDGRYGRIHPYSLDGKTLGVTATSDPFPMSARKAANLVRQLEPLCIHIELCDGGEFAATFPRDRIFAVAEIIRVRRRREQTGGRKFTAIERHLDAMNAA